MGLKIRLTRFYSFWLYPIAVVVLLFLAARIDPSRPLEELFWLMFAGVVLWTFLEYAMHRFLFHWIPRRESVRRFIESLHVSHHRAPRNLDRLFVRPFFSLTISALLLGAFYLALGSFFSAVGVLAGLWLGFLYYESVHFRVHFSGAAGALIGFQRRRHFHHHFVDDESFFGVTSPLWDFVFRTAGQKSSRM